MGYMCKTKGKMTQALYHSIFHIGAMKTFEWYCLNTSRIIFHHDNDPKHSKILIK